MNIRGLSFHRQDIPLTRPYEIAFLSHDVISMIAVTLETDGGLLGYGSATPSMGVMGESIDSCVVALEKVAELLRGPIYDLKNHCRHLKTWIPDAPAAQAAVDMALHDLWAKSLGISVVKALGQVHHSLPTSITIGIKGVRETLEEAKEYVGRGFFVLKVKLGKNLEEDIERLAALRAQYGDRVVIRVDPNQGYREDSLRTFLQRTAAFHLELIEEPCPPALDDSLRLFPEAERRRFAADESLHDARHALILAAQPQPFGIFNIKLMKCGGIAEALRIVNVAELAGIDLMWGCMDESVVSIAAALHVAFAAPNTRYIDLDGSLDLASDAFTGGFHLKDGRMSPLDLPGLGVKWSLS